MTNTMNFQSLLLSISEWLPAMVTVTIKTVVVIGLVMLVLNALPRLSSSTRHLILFAGVSAVILLPLFSLVIPAWKTIPRPTGLELANREPVRPVPTGTVQVASSDRPVMNEEPAVQATDADVSRGASQASPASPPIESPPSPPF